MLKKIQAAKEFSMRAERKRKLYRQGKTTAVTLVSRRHSEALTLVLFIFALQHTWRKEARCLTYRP